MSFAESALRSPHWHSFQNGVGVKPEATPGAKILHEQHGAQVALELEAVEERALRDGDLAEHARESAAAPQAGAPPTAHAKIRLTKLYAAELRAMCREVVGRETGSSDSAYLVWKLTQAQKGRVRVGPIERRSGGTSDVKVLPLRMCRLSLSILIHRQVSLGLAARWNA